MFRFIFGAVLVDTVPRLVHTNLVVDESVHVEVSGRLHELGCMGVTGLDSGGFST